MSHPISDFGSGGSALRLARNRVIVTPAHLRRGDWLQERGVPRVVMGSVVSNTGETYVVSFEHQDGYPNDLSVPADESLSIWRMFP